jgi:MinD superfamily P-loop ATPase
MKIAVASGKGGTGKTMVATSLAASLALKFSVEFLDCDVEEPNSKYFLKPKIDHEDPAVIQIPEIDAQKCTLCGKCVKVCEFHALANIGNKIIPFPQLCHGCGSCSYICPEMAITEKPREIGKISIGRTSSGIDFRMGELTISEPMASPIIRQLKAYSSQQPDVIILDSPPGASCSVVSTIYDADYVLLVTEPTPFGHHDLQQMFGVLSKTKTSAGVIINRDGIGNQVVEDYLKNQPYPNLAKIPFRKSIAAKLAAGEILTDFMPEYQLTFIEIFEKIRSQILVESKK